MEKKINLVELLKDCPKGMELDCALYDNCTFDGIEDVGYNFILINTPSGRIRLSKEGCYIRHDENAKCIIFPKGKATWEGFQRPFKDGDILVGKSGYPFIFKSLNNSDGCRSYCGIDIFKNFKLDSNDWTFADSLRFASEEEQEKLFKAIKDNGYRWDAETKTLKKLVEPKFKTGDKVKNKNNFIVTISRLDGDYYDYVNEDGQCGVIYIKSQNEWELVPNKFDINTLKTFDQVLVRLSNDCVWVPKLFSYYDTDPKVKYYPFVTIENLGYPQCIPYNGNEHLRRTINNCDEFYRVWEE